MKRPTKRSLIGKWRIIEMELWDKDFLDMMEPAYIAFDGKAGGGFAFGCVTGRLNGLMNVTPCNAKPSCKSSAAGKFHLLNARLNETSRVPRRTVPINASLVEPPPTDVRES